MVDKKYEIKFGDGKVSYVDGRVFGLLKKHQKNGSKLPKFWDLARGIHSYDEPFISFYGFVLLNCKLSASQLYQDLFVLFTLQQKKGGKFLEFGATNGLELSNSLLLERNFGWHGVLAEPSPQWHDQLRQNRPNTKIITDCIYSDSGKNLDFFVSDVGALSTLEEFRDSDNSSMPGNTAARNKDGYKVKVSTISLNDVFVDYFDSRPIDYMSVDTEGSELVILENFDFEKFGPKILTVEHNFTENEVKLDRLLEESNYRRVFRNYSQFDGWYIRVRTH